MPEPIEPLLRDAQACLQRGKPEEALARLRKAHAAAPADGRVQILLAQALRSAGDPQSALTHAQEAMRLLPAEAFCRYLGAQLHEDLQDVGAAIALLQEAVRLQPAYAEAHHYLGMLLADAHRNEQALAAFQAALRARPDYARAWNNYGNLLLKLGRPAEAENACRQALRLQPEYALALHNLGLALRDQGNRQAAIAAFRSALKLQAQRMETCLALGELLRADGQLDAAVELLNRSLALERPGKASLHLSLAHCLGECGDTAAARVMYREAARRVPRNLRAALGEALSLAPVYADTAAIFAARQRFQEGVSSLRERAAEFAREGREQVLASLNWSNFYLAYHGLDDRPLQLAYGEFVRNMLERIAPDWLEAPQPQGGERTRIRIGFASAFFSDSTVGNYFGRWITDLDPERFEVCIYHLRPSVDELAQGIAERAAIFRRLAGRTVSEIVQSIRADRLDLLVYPELGMDSSCFLMAAMRLAPVQCAAWGHPVTSGHANIDFYLSSAAMEPPGAAAHYVESLVGLPGIGTNYPRPPQPSAAARVQLGLPEDRELLLLPQSLYKIHPDNDTQIAEILARRPQASLLLFNGRHDNISAQLQKRLTASLLRAGIKETGRIQFLPFVPRERYLQINRVCDLMLDTLHWSGGNTSLDALASQLPMVTMPGPFMRGRQSMAMLDLAGMPELVANDADSYVARCVELLENQEYRADCRRRLSAAGDRLFEDPLPGQVLQDFFTACVTPGASLDRFLLEARE